MHIGVFAHTNDLPAFETGVTRYNIELLACLNEDFHDADITLYVSPSNAHNYEAFPNINKKIRIKIISIKQIDYLFPFNGIGHLVAMLMFCALRHTPVVKYLWGKRLLSIMPELAEIDILLYTPYGLHTYIPSMAKCLFQLPVISAVHDVRSFIVEKQFSFSKSVSRFMTKCLIDDSSYVLIPSNYILQILSKRARLSNNKALISFCVPPTKRTSEDGDTSKIKSILEKYNLPSKYIYFPSTIVKTKNHLRLLNALSMLNKNDCRVNLVMVGTISDKNIYRQMNEHVNYTNLSNQVLHLGYINETDKNILYQGATALVMPTIGESFGLPIWEAFSFGCPVITSLTYDMNEQVANAALLVDPYSIEDLAEKIRLLWTDDSLRHDYGLRGRARYESMDGMKFRRDWAVSINKVVKTR